MAISTISPGIDTGLSTKLNGNFAETRHLVTRTYTNTSVTTTSSSMQDVLTVSTPAATKASQVVFIDAAFSWSKDDSADTIQVELWDDSASTQLALFSQGAGTYSSAEHVTAFLQTTVTLAAATNTKSIQLRVRRSAGTSGAVGVYTASMTCMLVES
jgi:hypothetical protein